ncbi:hypothetical protein K1719_044593 [Acacia pycnantha]|nr:hypothetical protein K1719_044593 [Acacia pycnantha]
MNSRSRQCHHLIYVVHFTDSIIDSLFQSAGEVCKAIICLEIAATWMGILFDRSSAIRLSGMSEKAYIRSYNLMHNSIGVKTKLDVRELAIQFGCVRIISYVRDGLNFYKERFCHHCLLLDKHKLKVDKLKLIEQCGTSESEFSSVSTSMKDLCRDTVGVAKEKKDPREVKTNRDLLDALPEKGELKMVVIRLMNDQIFQIIRNTNKWKNMTMRSASLQCLHQRIKTKQKVYELHHLYNVQKEFDG